MSLSIGSGTFKLPPLDAYKAFGDQASTAQSQGWYPETRYGNVTVFRSPHDHAFNDVKLDDGSLGHIALLGHDNQRFDVVIRDKDGQIQKTLMQGISPSDVQQYITNSNSTVSQRNNNIINGNAQGGIVWSQ